MNFKPAVRTLRKNPFITAAAILSLAIGIGANTAIFSIFHQVLIRQLPVEDPGRLVNLSSPGPKQGSLWAGEMGNDASSVFSYPMFKDLERAQTIFTGIAAHLDFNGHVSYDGRTESVNGLAVSGSYFPLLGLRPALGRLFDPADDAVVDEPHTVVISYDYWQNHFGADRRILNRTLILNGQSMTIVGVAPAGFRGTTVGYERQLFVPITMMRFAWTEFRSFEDRKQYLIYLFARLKPGITIAQASSAINVAYRNILNEVEAPLQRMSPDGLERFKSRQLLLESGSRGQSYLTEQSRIPLLLLAGVTVCVLLIACSNIANLLLARGTARSTEMAVRLSIGASRKQLVMQLMLESCLLAALGGIGSIVVAQWTLGGMSLLMQSQNATLEYELNSTAVLFSAALTIGAAILFGLSPALQSTRLDFLSGIKAQAGQAGASRTTARFRTSLTTAQIGLSMALLILAGLFIKSLINVSREQFGLNTDHVVTFRVAPGINGYGLDRTLSFLERVEDGVGQMPGVTSFGASTVPLFGGDAWVNTIKVEGFQSGSDIDSNSNYALVSPDYFKTLGIPLISGREFSRTDRARSSRVAIVNEQFLKKFHLGRNDAIGKRIAPANRDLDTEIVGVVQNSKYSDVKEKPPAVFYLPYRQVEGFSDPLDEITFYARTSLDTGQLLKAIPPVVAGIDSDVPVERARTLPEQVQQNISTDLLVTALSVVFAIIATVLAAVGLYAVLAYIVAQRTKEIGIRVALGAAPLNIHAMILRYVGWMTMVGGAAGLAAAIAAGRFAESLLFKLNGHDPFVLGGGVVLLSLIAFGAGFIPARRAAKVDPMKALRYE